MVSISGRWLPEQLLRLSADPELFRQQSKGIATEVGRIDNRPDRRHPEIEVTTTDIQAVNQKVADSLNDEARLNPQSPYTGKVVGIANGQVVVVADDWDELDQQMRLLFTDPSNTLSFEVGLDYEQVQEIWVLL